MSLPVVCSWTIVRQDGVHPEEKSVFIMWSFYSTGSVLYAVLITYGECNFGWTFWRSRYFESLPPSFWPWMILATIFSRFETLLLLFMGVCEKQCVQKQRSRIRWAEGRNFICYQNYCRQWLRIFSLKFFWDAHGSRFPLTDYSPKFTALIDDKSFLYIKNMKKKV